MKISVVIIAYNIEEYIKRCLLSIIQQTLNDIEIIVVNDGSTDNTRKIIEEIVKNNNKIVLLNKKNEGPIESRKAGLKIAKGEYILFVDGDDWLEEDALKKLYQKANDTGSDIILCNAYWAYDNKKEKRFMFKPDDNIKSDPLKYLFLGDIMPAMWGKLISRRFIEDNNIEFPNNISYAEDLASLSNWFMNSPKIDYIEESLYNYYQRENGITKTVSSRILEVDKAISFIEENLLKRGLFHKYEKEFEKMVFTHLLMFRVLMPDKLQDIHKKIYKCFKKRKIKIYKNDYIKKEISKNNLIFKIRVRLYYTSYNLGKLYDLLRHCFFKVLSKN